MVLVRVVERAVHLVVDVVPVRDRRVAAAGAVPLGALYRGAGVRVAPVDLDGVLVDVPLVPAVKVTVVKVVGMVPVADGRVAAPRPVRVLVLSRVRRTDHSSLASRPIVPPRAPSVNPPRGKA